MRLPLKVVPVLEGDVVRPHVGGGPAKSFREVDDAFRVELESKIDHVRDHFQASFNEFPNVPAVARVKVRDDAVAKTHRPLSLFNEKSCPIIASDGLDELLVSVTPQGLETLALQVRTTLSKRPLAHMSTLLDIQPVLPLFELPTNDEYAKVKLFRHHIPARDSQLDQTFLAILKRLELEGQELRYGNGLKIFKVRTGHSDRLQELARYIGTQSLGAFPSFHPLRSASIPVREATLADFPSPAGEVDYPIVGLVDTGIDPNDRFLSPWVIARETYVPEAERDYSHGTFVGGLIANAKPMNHGDDRFPSCSSKIVDVVALGTGKTNELDLITILEEVIPKYPSINVWNLSLSAHTPVKDEAFSDFAVKLDSLQDEFKTTIVLAAGNYTSPPLRSWPPQEFERSG